MTAPLILGTNSIKDEGYEVANSLRFDDGSSDSLTKSFGSAGNRSVWTWSAWLKFSTFDSFHPIFTAGNWSSGSTATGFILYQGSFYSYWNSPAGGTSTSAKFRDTSAWYHVVLQANTSTLKLYVNSEEQTSRSISGSGEINNSSSEHGLGKYSNSTSAYFDGYMAEVCFIDGQALDPTSFGVFNTVSNIWEPRPYAGTYGNSGFRLDFSDSSALGDDVSGNGNDFTVNNLTSIDQVTDTCSNNFATMNPIASQAGSNTSSSVATFSDGNLVVDAVVSETVIANIGVDTGKWFWEVKVLTDQDGIAIGGANQHFHLDAELGYNSPSSPSDAKIFTYNGNGQKATTVGDGSQFSSYGNAIAVNDIIGVALNLDDDEVTYYKNGTAQNSGTPISLTALGSGEQYFPAVGNWSASSIKVSFNFGSPAFTISSGNSDANGFGNFEYSVPSGYFALCTKNLAEYG